MCHILRKLFAIFRENVYDFLKNISSKLYFAKTKFHESFSSEYI